MWGKAPINQGPSGPVLLGAFLGPQKKAPKGLQRGFKGAPKGPIGYLCTPGLPQPLKQAGCKPKAPRRGNWLRSILYKKP